MKIHFLQRSLAKLVNFLSGLSLTFVKFDNPDIFYTKDLTVSREDLVGLLWRNIVEDVLFIVFIKVVAELVFQVKLAETTKS